MLGLCLEEYRLPLCPPSDTVKKRLAQLLEQKT
jgi:hypothetical protein